MPVACVHPLLGLFWVRLHLSSPKLRSQDPRPKGTSSWAIVPPGRNSSWTRRSQGCLAEELLLPQLPHLLSASLLCRQVSARPLYLIALWKLGGTMPHGAGDGHQCLLLSARCQVLSLRGSKKQNTRMGHHPVSFSPVRL